MRAVNPTRYRSAPAPTAAPRPGAAPYAGQVITKTPDWAGLTAVDIWLNNLSTGTFLVAALGALLAPASFGGLARYAYPLALLFLLGDLALLVADLGDPWRFHHLLRVFKPSSPISFGTWALSLYAALLALASLAAVLEWPLLGSLRGALHAAGLWSLIAGAGQVFAVLAIVPAMGGLLYKGVMFSVTSQPGWKAARWLSGYFADSAILLGCSVLVLLALLVRLISAQAAAPALPALRAASMALVLLDAVFLALLYRNIAPVYRARFGVNQKMFIWIAILVGGIILPFILLLGGTLLIAAPPLLILAAALVARYVLVLLPRR